VYRRGAYGDHATVLCPLCSPGISTDIPVIHFAISDTDRVVLKIQMTDSPARDRNSQEAPHEPRDERAEGQEAPHEPRDDRAEDAGDSGETLAARTQRVLGVNIITPEPIRQIRLRNESNADEFVRDLLVGDRNRLANEIARTNTCVADTDATLENVQKAKTTKRKQIDANYGAAKAKAKNDVKVDRRIKANRHITDEQMTERYKAALGGAEGNWKKDREEVEEVGKQAEQHVKKRGADLKSYKRTLQTVDNARRTSEAVRLEIVMNCKR